MGSIRAQARRYFGRDFRLVYFMGGVMDRRRSTLMHLTPGSAFHAVPSNICQVTVNRCESSTSY